MRIVLIILALSLTGCGTHPSANGQPGWHVWAPTTWPIFSGASAVNKAAADQKRVDLAHDEQANVRQTAGHAAHLEFLKASLALLEAPASKQVDAARRFIANGLGLLDQFDPLSGSEVFDARSLVVDIVSADVKRAAAAEKKQEAAEISLGDVSKRLQASDSRADKAEATARQSNTTARATALENIELANELRSMHWAAGILMTLLALGGVLLVYVRLQLGGIGAALHAVGAPAHLMQAINANTSSLGQWFVHTGREAAAKAQAVLSVKTTTGTPTS